MQIRSLFAGAALVLGLVAVAPSSAQAQVGFVVQGSYGFDIEEFAVGGGINTAIGSLTETQGIRLEATFDYYLVGDGVKSWEVNGNLLKDIPAIANLYVGAGVNYVHASYDCGSLCDAFDVDDSNSEVGLNILGGYRLGAGKAAPFVQARFSLGGGEQLVVTGGFRF